MKLAPYFLPATRSIYGRCGKRRSHYLYICSDPDPKATIKQLDDASQCIVELRLGGGGKGAQSVWPGSIHTSAERYEWDEDGAPGAVACGLLKAGIAKIAVGVLLVRHWPANCRHDACLCLGGFLARGGWTPEVIGDFIVAVQEVASVEDPSHIENGRRAAFDAATAHVADGKGYGLPTLIEFFGEAVAKRIAKILDYGQRGAPTSGRPVGRHLSGNAPEANMSIQIDDFVAYMPGHTYIFKPTREMWPVESVNARIPRVDNIRASAWLDVNRPVEQMTWAPGEPMEIKDKLIAEGGWIERPGCSVFNLYRPPTSCGKPGDTKPWVDHVRKVYPEDADHIIMWLAHRVQKPAEKINHALVLGGAQGIGKDTLLEPVKQAVGPWNFIEVSPRQIFGRFNGFLKSVILRVNEARDLGDVNRYAFYDHMKTYTAAPPDVVRVDEKYLREYSVPNVCGVIFTTNYKTDGIYLAVDDRRHYIAWSSKTEMDFEDDYWQDLYGWYKGGGIEHVTAYLATYNLANFDPKAPPPKTSAFCEIVAAGKPPEHAELADALDKLGWPDVVTLSQVAEKATPDFAIWIRDRRNSRLIPKRMEACSYVAVQNPDDKSDGRWRVNDKRQVIYGKADLPLPDRTLAAKKLAGVRP